MASKTVKRATRRARAKRAAPITAKQAESPIDDPPEAQVIRYDAIVDVPAWARPGWRPLQPGEQQEPSEDDRQESVAAILARALPHLGQALGRPMYDWRGHKV